MNLKQGSLAVASHIDRLARWSGAALVAGFTAMVVYVVISRYLFSSTPRWAEELPRLALVWLTFVGAISGFVRGTHFRAGLLDLIAMPPALRRLLSLVAWVASFAFLAMFIWTGWKLTGFTWSHRLLDADIYGPSQPRMMGVNKRPASPDGKTIIPLHAHGVTLMSIGFMLEEDKAVVWRGPMLMGALQQMLGQVQWGELDVLLVDLPPGTGDVQLTLCQKSEVTGAIVVSTPQDVALLDARKAINMFHALKTPVLGLIENMSMFICPDCGSEHEIFGHGGVKDEAEKMGVPLLGALPIDLETRLAGDRGTPVAASDGAMADAYARIAEGLIKGGMA